MPDLDDQIAAFVRAALAGAQSGIQEVEGVAWQLYLLQTLALSAGVQLDGMGDVLRLTRDLQSDSDYRNALNLARRVNSSRGTIPEIIDAAVEQPGVDSVQVQNSGQAYYSVYLHGTELDELRRLLLRAMRAAGIGTDIISAGSDPWPFVFGADVNISEEITQDGVVLTQDGDPLTQDDTGEAGDADPDGGGWDDAFVVTGFTGPATFRVGGNASSEFTGGGAGIGELIEVVGSSGDDGFYRVVAVAFAAGETSLQVTPNPPVGAGDGQLHHAAPEWAPLLLAARSTHGEFADVFVD